MSVQMFNILGLLLFTFFALPTIYQLQIKEYYIPRIRAGWEDKEGFFIPFRLPAFSPRNILLLLMTGFLLVIYYLYFGSLFNEINIWYILFWISGTLLSKLFVVLGMFITEPLALFRRSNLAKRAAKLREGSNTLFVGVTGSYGKSSVKDFLTQFMSQKYKTASTDKNKNSEVGVSVSIVENLRRDTDIFIAEMGAYSLGSIERSAELVKPKIGFITGLTKQHLTLFGSFQNIIDAKSELIEALPEDGTLYINRDFPEWKQMAQRAECKVVTYSILEKEADMYAYTIDDDRIRFKYRGREFTFKDHLKVEHHILNIAGVIAFAVDMGFSDEEVEMAFARLHIPEKKLKRQKLKNGATMIDDSYNSNPVGFMKALALLTEGNGKKVAVTKGLLELGEDKVDEYSKLLEYCWENEISLITTDSLFKRMWEDDDCIHVKSEKEILPLVKALGKDDQILLEGRFSPKFMSQIKKLYE